MRSAAFACGLSILMACSAHADGVSTAISSAKPGPSGWQFNFTPYGWLTWVDGNATVRGRDFSVQQNPGQVLSDLEGVWMSYMEAKRGAITLFSDVIYADIGNSSSFARSHTFTPHINGSVGGAVRSDYSFWIVEAGFMYETNRYKWGNSSAETDTTLDLLMGLRYWHQDLDVNLSLAGNANIDGLVVSGAGAWARSGSVSWVDLFMGARLTHTPTPGHELALRGDFGGFGWGSQFTWQLIGTYSAYLGSHSGIDFNSYVGYKALSVDYDQGVGHRRYEFDVIQHGPVIGLTGKF
ncbi:hypothetical protein [Hyphomicrobium sulfonivorans]|uniref:Outer membrane protein beta-barrel domain-containing protein n=1 Tax=Hyphomicrobium sulfonivorans TaxID=121290 RepID=A0A125NTU2_HYPSL|nr:hypothetical protein [Hyphomicrobium sulfonivorans]KWT64585.1 hypothetical protein APY04_3253 [Hyphomicrobium sulfonivorans]MBI1650403.1 hypothetical protein [Hyphomicrobium sulfonivorans]NSL72236.1 hypothetical protein [Hyphomicrobium sulfonivorans]